MRTTEEKTGLRAWGPERALPNSSRWANACRRQPLSITRRCDRIMLARALESVCRPAHLVAAGGQQPSYYWLSAAPSEPTFPDGVAGLLALAEELHIRHDRLVGMLRLPMRNVCLVIGNADHQTRSSRAPVTGGPHCTGGPVEQILKVRHGYLQRPPRQARFPLRSAADCPTLAGY